jgi:glucose/arabinose dehydrogenase
MKGTAMERTARLLQHASPQSRVAFAATVMALALTLGFAPPAMAASGVDLGALSLGATPAWTGFDHPLYVTGAGDGSNRLFVVEQGGTIRVIRGGVVQPAPYLDVRGLTTMFGERGLLGLAFSPGFATNGRLYINYTNRDGNTVVARYVADNPGSDTPVFGPPQTVLFVRQPYANHNGGNLQFGPDGYLYIGLGDGGSAGDPQKRAQNRKVLLGKMLRIDTGDRPGTTPFAGTYRIPKNNPFVKKRGYRKEIWALGLRNPWRYSFDAQTGDLWIADVGQDTWEEIDFAGRKGGQNWGWNQWEGNHRFLTRPRRLSRRGYTFPIAEYKHPTGESVTGGYVYRGSAFPALVGTYLYADFVDGWIAGIRRTSTTGQVLRRPQKARLLQTSAMISSFGQDDARELYFTDYRNGSVWRVTATTK